jgi:hypothetical protein
MPELAIVQVTTGLHKLSSQNSLALHAWPQAPQLSCENCLSTQAVVPAQQVPLFHPPAKHCWPALAPAQSLG